jgi:hypothetical protein
MHEARRRAIAKARDMVTSDAVPWDLIDLTSDPAKIG